VQNPETQLQKFLNKKQIDKIKKGDLFSEDEIKKITKMLKSLVEQIKDEKIRVFLSNAVDFLGTIEKDEYLSTEEKEKIIGKKQKMGSSYFAATPHRGRSRSRADVEAENEQIEKECPICRNEYDEEKCNPQPLECKHKLCKTCVGLITEPTGQIKCPFCRLRSKSPAASARGLPAAASARGLPAAASARGLPAAASARGLPASASARGMSAASARGMSAVDQLRLITELSALSRQFIESGSLSEHLEMERRIKDIKENIKRQSNDTFLLLFCLIYGILITVYPNLNTFVNMGKTIVGMFVLFIIGVCLKK
jgi:hypothetical protein